MAQAQFGAGNRRWWLGLMPPAVLAGALAVSGLDTFGPTTAVAQEKPAEQPVYNYVVEQWRRAAEDYGKKHEIDMSGKGSKIAFISYSSRSLRQTDVKYTSHAVMQHAMMVGETGLLPKAQVGDFPFRDYNNKDMWFAGDDGTGKLVMYKGGFPVPWKDDADFVKLLMTNMLTVPVITITKHLNDIADEGKGKYQAVHLALATSKYKTLDWTYGLLERYSNQLGNIRQLVYNPDDDRVGRKLALTNNPADRIEKMKRLRIYFEKQVSLDPSKGDLKTVLDNYRKAVKRVSDEADAVFVNSFGNEQDELDAHKAAGFVHDDFIDLFTLTGSDLKDSVIHVAASDTKGTVFKFEDDGISTESTPGTAEVLPTIAAPGHQIIVTVPSEKKDGKSVVKLSSGTSPAVALTVGAVTMARVASGNKLSAKETVQLMRSTAYVHSGLTSRQMGSGLLDLEKLLTEAGKKRSR
ncbi:MAG: S8 family serine peptidase [Cyanobacteria bacterium HKST-UBA03]|nr:S8 family serine peptidase [Cyanobacteria bacterium HKST-UBA03]